MILRRDLRNNAKALLGLKIIGGRKTENGQSIALIQNVKKGSIADIEGQLRPGNEEYML